MKLKTRLLTLLLLLLPLQALSQWKPDILGDGYQMRTVTQPSDYSGPVVSTVIRKLVGDTIAPGRPAILYVHGFNDYFFNPELGRQSVAHGYDFYAVDLRKYGRSIRPGQSLFECRSLKEYFPDIDSALVEINRNRPDKIILMGHSTGGLITAYYMAQTHNHAISALVLNSPFLDWNLGWKERLVPLISWWGSLFPTTRIPQGDSTAYSESLLSSEKGEWNYRTDWKLKRSPDVTAGWVHAINTAQRSLRNGKARIDIPILLMYSGRSVNESQWSPLHNRADGVLDVADIRKYGRQLGPHVTCLQVNGGLHDLLLSRPPLRALLYTRLFDWLAAIPAS